VGGMAQANQSTGGSRQQGSSIQDDAPRYASLRRKRKWLLIPSMEAVAHTVLHKLAREPDIRPVQIVWAVLRMAMLLPDGSKGVNVGRRATQLELEALNFLAATLGGWPGLLEGLAPGQVVKLLAQLALVQTHPYFQQHSPGVWPWDALSRRCQAIAGSLRTWEVVSLVHSYSQLPLPRKPEALRALRARALASKSAYDDKELAEMMAVFARMGLPPWPQPDQFFSDNKWRTTRSIRETAVVVLHQLSRAQRLRVSNLVGGAWRMASFLPSIPTNGSLRASESELAAVDFLAAALRETPAMWAEQLPQLLKALARIRRHPYFRQHKMGAAWPWAALERSCVACAAQLSPKELAQVIWAYSYLPVRPSEETLQALRDRAAQDMGKLLPTQLSAVMCGFTRMGFHPGEDFLLSGTAAALIAGIPSFLPRDLCALLSAFAACGWNPGPALMRAVEEVVAARCADFSVRELANLMCSFAHLAHEPHEIIQSGDATVTVLNIIQDEICERRDAVLNPMDISQFLWASASLNFPTEPRCLDLLQRRALQCLGDFTAADLSNMLWGLAWHMPDVEFVPSFKDEVAQAALSKLATFTPQGLSNVMLAYANFKDAQPALSYAVEQQMLRSFPQYNEQDVANITCAFSRLGYTPSEALLGQVEEFLYANVHTIGAEELQKLCLALARLGHVAGTHVREAVRLRLQTGKALHPRAAVRINSVMEGMDAMEAGDGSQQRAWP